MAKQEQEVLPGVPGPAKRKVIAAIEDKCVALSDKIAEQSAEIQTLLVDHKLEVYTYEDSNGVLQDVIRESALKKRKSKLNPKKSKKGDE